MALEPTLTFLAVKEVLTSVDELKSGLVEYSKRYESAPTEGLQVTKTLAVFNGKVKPEIGVRRTGTAGTSGNGVTALEGAEARLFPAALVAVTVNV